MTKEEYNKKIKRYEFLGALKFQNIVFKIEKAKFFVIKKLFPNYIRFYDKLCDYQKKKLLKKAKTEEQKIKIIENAKFAKMAMRKELREEKNRNYHIDNNRPTEIKKYLLWNKQVHKNGLIKDGVCIALLIGGVIFQIPGSKVLLIAELLSAGINFECINIQNYNLCRLERIEPVLKKKEERIIKKEIEDYGEVSEVIYKTIEKNNDIPTIDDIINNIKTKEQLEQLRSLLMSKQEERNKAKEKVKGGGR